jgi:hypothetical protein
MSGGLIVDGRGRFHEVGFDGAVRALDLPRDGANGDPIDVVPGPRGHDDGTIARMDSGAVRLLTREGRWSDITTPPTHARHLAGEANVVCAIVHGGHVRCWPRWPLHAANTDAQTAALREATNVPHLALADAEEVVVAWPDPSDRDRSRVCVRGASGAVVCAGIFWPSRDYRAGTQLVTYAEPLLGDVPAARHVAVGARDLCVIARDGRVYCAWGPEFDAPRDAGGPSVTLRRAPSLDGAVEIALGHGFGCARWPSGPVRCWGAFVRSGAVVERSTPVPMPDLDHAERILGTYDEWCALQRGGLVCRAASERRSDLQATVPRSRTVSMSHRITSATVDVLSPRWERFCASLEGGALECQSAQAFPPPSPSILLHSVAAARERLCALDVRSRAWCTSLIGSYEDSDEPFRRATPFDGYERLLVTGEHVCAWRRDAPLRCERSSLADERVPRRSPFEGTRDAVDGLGGGCLLFRDGTVRCPYEETPTATRALVSPRVSRALPAAIVEALGGAVRRGVGYRDYFYAVGVNGRVAFSRLVSDGRGGWPEGEPSLIQGIDDVQEITVGAIVCARRGDGRVYCWGRNVDNTLTAEEAGRSSRLVPLRR